MNALVIVACAIYALHVVPPSRAIELSRAIHAAYDSHDIAATLAAARALAEEDRRVRALAGRGIPDDHVRDADERTETALRFLATTWVNVASGKVNGDAERAAAHEMYELYLAQFATSPNAYEMRFLYAELLSRDGRFADAAREYRRVHDADAHGKWAAVSAEETVRATYEVLVAAGPRPVVTARRALTAEERALVDACERYLAAYPRGRIAEECAYRVARMHHDAGSFQESTPRLVHFIAEYPRSLRVALAVQHVLDSYAAQEDWQALAAFVRTVEADPVLSSAPAVRELLPGR